MEVGAAPPMSTHGPASPQLRFTIQIFPGSPLSRTSAQPWILQARQWMLTSQLMRGRPSDNERKDPRKMCLASAKTSKNRARDARIRTGPDRMRWSPEARQAVSGEYQAMKSRAKPLSLDFDVMPGEILQFCHREACAQSSSGEWCDYTTETIIMRPRRLKFFFFFFFFLKKKKKKKKENPICNGLEQRYQLSRRTPVDARVVWQMPTQRRPLDYHRHARTVSNATIHYRRRAQAVDDGEHAAVRSSKHIPPLVPSRLVCTPQSPSHWRLAGI
ncbi:hypothetical protein F5Y15DRAFT_104261 [Xylariaceae sp. FL0016]|nr:hypothetical protein F5Y15DRAFT_104261 [Xylariaceae sp. FL0016]